MTDFAAQQRETRFRLLDLPLEVRDQIYRNTLREDSHTVQTATESSWEADKNGISMIYVLMINCLRPAMLRVNRQIHDEYLATAFRYMELSIFFETDPNKEIFEFLPLPEYTGLPKSVHDSLLAAEFGIEYHNDGIHFFPLSCMENLSTHLPSLRKLSIEVDLDERRLSRDGLETVQLRIPGITSFFDSIPASRQDLSVSSRLVIATELFTLNDRYTFSSKAEHDHICEMWDSGLNLVRFRGTPSDGPHTYYGLELESEPSNVSWQQLWKDVKIFSTEESKAMALVHWEWFKR